MKTNTWNECRIGFMYGCVIAVVIFILMQACQPAYAKPLSQVDQLKQELSAAKTENMKLKAQVKAEKAARDIHHSMSKHWYEAFEQCEQNNYAEAWAQEAYDVELEIENCDCAED